MRFPKLSTAAPILALAALSACGVRTTTTMVNPAYTRAATCAAAVTVYDSRAQVPSDYYELAWIQAEGNSVYTTNNQLQTQIINNAAKVGANAVIANPVQQANTTSKVLGAAIGANTSTAKASALAIYTPADSGRVMTACGPPR
jgi:hypothetical protein